MLDMLTSARFWVSFVLLCALPYGMYVVAYLFESRKPGNGPNDAPIWHGQSKAFLPGDIGLSLLLAVAMYLQIGRYVSGWMLLLGAVVGVVVYNLARRFTYTPKDYSPGAWNSPSKRWHDLVMYIVFVMLLVAFGIPSYFASWNDGVGIRLAGLAGLGVWVVCMVKDLIDDEVPNDRQHPTTYRPIWRKA